ncbi:MAG: FAD-dependent oxidoreductase [Dehalococcoidales bacterium]|nr:FAD-dependent oxidoreductase [Dehalococcoidales bacterium]
MADRYIKEPGQDIKVLTEAEVVVVGGGPGGHSAAVAAARNGAKTVLVERYGHLGGMATGGIVIQIPHMSDGSEEQQIAGLTQEWIDRLDPIGGVLVPRRSEIGSPDEKLVSYWRRFMGNVNKGRIEYTAWVDPELLKCILNDMVEDAGIKLLLHSWGTRAIVEDGVVKGVVFESKSGRQAVMGKVIIDGTGDGDLLPTAGAEWEGGFDPSLRSSMLALVFRIGNGDYQKYCDFRENEPEKAQSLMNEMTKIAGTRLLPLPSPRNDVMWVNNWIPNLDNLNVEHLTELEVSMRKMMRKGFDFLKKNIPGFENSFILDTASQTGTRGGRRVIGETRISDEDIKSGKQYPDTIAVIPRMGPPQESHGKYVYIPYRCLVPVKTEGLLVAGRSFSSDGAANNMANLIPHCIAMGQASGTAAAMAVKEGIQPRQVDYGKLQEKLLDQDVPLPGIIPAKVTS